MSFPTKAIATPTSSLKKKKDFLLKCLKIYQHKEVEPRSAKIGYFFIDGEPLYWIPEVKEPLDGSFVLLIAPYRRELNPAEPSIGATQDVTRTLMPAAPLAPLSMLEAGFNYSIDCTNTRPPTIHSLMVTPLT